MKPGTPLKDFTGRIDEMRIDPVAGMFMGRVKEFYGKVNFHDGIGETCGRSNEVIWWQRSACLVLCAG
jgi:hypothetical protein